MKILILNNYNFWKFFEKGISIKDVDLKKNSKRLGVWFYTKNDIPLFPKNKGYVEWLENFAKSRKKSI